MHFFKEGNGLTDSDKVQDRWKEYIEDLYDKNNKPQYKIMHLQTQKKITKDHIYTRVQKILGFSKKPNPLGFFLKTRFFFKKRAFLENPILVDFWDVLLGFEEFKNKPDQWVLDVLLFWVFLTLLLELGVLNAVHFKYWINVEGNK